MATFSGSEGVVKVGTIAIGEIRSYTIEQSMDTLEDTAMGDTNRTYKASLKTFTGSCDVLFDDTNTGQQAMSVGSEVTMSFLMEGDTVGDHKLSGTVLITGRSISASYDGLVEASLSFQGTGALTEGLVTV